MANEKSPFYLNNPNLKSIAQPVEWTEDSLQAERYDSQVY